MSTVQLRHAATLVTGSTPPGSLGDEAYDSMGLSWIRPNDLLEANIPVDSSKHLSESGEAYSRIINQPACVLVGIGSIGKLGFALPPFATNQQIISIIPKTGWDMKYLYYVLKNSEQWLKANANGTTLPILNTNDLGRLPVPLKSFEQQKRIANELDYELTKIDQLIADQLYLQELLAERLTSLTFELATDASNSDRYETGDPFWKTLPKGWTLQKLGWLFNDIGSGTTPSSSDLSAYKDGVINWVTTGELREQGVAETNKKITEATLGNYSALKIHPAGSIMIAMYGATIGRLGWLDEPATVNQAVCALSGASGVLPTYAYYVLLAAKSYLISQASGGGQPNISQSIIRALPVPVPSLQEQKRIVRKLEQAEKKHKKIIADLTELQKLQNTQRSSLIAQRIHYGNSRF